MGDFSSEYQSFRLLNLKHNDGGTYQCIAKNDVGSILSQKIEINIACKFTKSIELKKINYSAIIIFENILL